MDEVGKITNRASRSGTPFKSATGDIPSGPGQTSGSNLRGVCGMRVTLHALAE